MTISPVKLKMELEFLSLGCNRVVDVLDWGLNGLVAFGGHWSLAVFLPEVRSDRLHTNLSSEELRHCIYLVTNKLSDVCRRRGFWLHCQDTLFPCRPSIGSAIPLQVILL